MVNSGANSNSGINHVLITLINEGLSSNVPAYLRTNWIKLIQEGRINELGMSIAEYMKADSEIFQEQLSGLSEKSRKKVDKLLQMGKLDFRIDTSKSIREMVSQVRGNVLDLLHWMGFHTDRKFMGELSTLRLSQDFDEISGDYKTFEMILALVDANAK